MPFCFITEQILFGISKVVVDDNKQHAMLNVVYKDERIWDL